MSYRTARYESGPGDPVWENKSRELVRAALDDQGFKTQLNEADIVQLRDEAMKDGRIDHPVHVVKTAQRLLQAWAFSTQLSALQRAKELASKYDGRGLAARQLIFEAADELDCDFGDARALEAIILRLGAQGSIPLSEQGRQDEQQARAVAAEQAERSALIQNITRGKDAFPLFVPAHGRAKNVSSASLQNESTERLREIDKAVSAYRSQRDGVRVAPVAPNVDEGVIAAVPAQKAVPYMGGATDLINPKTGAEFTRDEVNWLVKNDLPMFRKLMSRNIKRLNEILDPRS